MGDCRKSFKLQDLLSHEQFALWRKPQSLQSGDMRSVWCLSDQEIFEFTKYTTQRWPSVDVALAHLQYRPTRTRGCCSPLESCRIRAFHLSDLGDLSETCNPQHQCNYIAEEDKALPEGKVWATLRAERGTSQRCRRA